jgi:2-dehydro-3-deoxy-phosphogluconate/2-dehydro-3-deoxy-6-phosphogalactonate aldolase
MRRKIVPVITPFERNRIKIEYLKNHVSEILKDGVDYIFLCGSTGLGTSLDFGEKAAMLTALEDYADRIIFQVGSLNLSESLRLAELAKSKNVHAISSYPPFYYPRIPVEWVISYFFQLSKIYPLVIYNFPLATGFDVSAEVVKKVIVKGGRVLGIKDTVNDMAHMLSFKWKLGDDFEVYSGPDSMMLAAARMGLDGSVAGSGNYATELFVRLLSEPDSSESDEIQRLLVELASLSIKYGQWSANYNLTRLIRGYEIGSPRPPVFPLTAARSYRLNVELQGLLGSKRNKKILGYLKRTSLQI